MEPERELYLIIGLGNPGAAYRETRHNIGFKLADLLSAQGRRPFERREAQSLLCRTERAGRNLLLAKPQTYMNRSGRAVRALLEIYPVDLSRLLIVYDEAALPFGKLRFRRAGSSGGQKGMGSIIQALGTERIPRLRIGVGGDEPAGNVADYVLSEFDRKEREQLDEILERAVRACDSWLKEGIDQAMARFN